MPFWAGKLRMQQAAGAMPDVFLAYVNSERRLTLRLFWVSCVMLFYEVLLVRWISSEIRLFSYFHNLILLFAFLGIGLGAASSRFRHNTLLLTYGLTASLAVLMRLDRFFGVSPLQDISNLLSQGTGFLMWWQPSPLPLRGQMIALLTGYAGFALVMGTITLLFVPFGQILGRLFEAHKRPLHAYGANLAGGLLGIWLFSAVSFLSLPPTVWFGLGGLACLPLLPGRRPASAAALLVGLSLLVLHEEPTADRWTIWSPYHKLTVVPESTTLNGQQLQYGYRILVNSVGYMQIVNYSPSFVQLHPEAFPDDEVPYDHYNMPYRFAASLQDVLVVGAGAGNDVAGALRNGAQQVEAVDIDPVIIGIGRLLHPESPYVSGAVTVVNDDARSFFKKANGQYDVIVLGLLDSHTLSSSYSNVRLDNYVYTIESLGEAKRLLKPDGVMVLMFEVADDFIGARLQQELSLVFDQQPVLFSVRSGFRGWGGTGFVVGNEAAIAGRIAADPRLASLIEQNRPTSDRWAGSPVRLATDDWPYLYLVGRGIPPLYLLVLGTLVVFSAGAVRTAFGGRQSLNWPFFFLGAGFLLLEVQNVSKTALLFGATWTVAAIVISAILVMLFLANLYAMRMRPAEALLPYYLGLCAALALTWVVPPDLFTGLPTMLKLAVAGGLMGLPIFLAGVIFSASFATTEQPASALASNLLGAMVGGALETTSFLTGIKTLVLIACLLYLLSWLIQKVRPAASRG